MGGGVLVTVAYYRGFLGSYTILKMRNVAFYIIFFVEYARTAMAMSAYVYEVSFRF